MEFFQPLTITTEMMLSDLLTEIRKELTLDNLREVARF